MNMPKKYKSSWIENHLRNAFVIAPVALASTHALALDGGTLQVTTYNGWEAIEVITQGNNPSGDGVSYSMPGVFDGAGAWMVDGNTLRVQVNHETSDASVSEVDLDLANVKQAISNMIANGNTGGQSFVLAARQAYDRWSSNSGSSWTNTSNTSSTSFSRFCSGQAYEANTFGVNRGFVDAIYITGEEVSSGRLFALDSANRDFYQLSGTVGAAAGGIGGMSFDSWENAALVDTGETNYIALMLSPDGGSARMKLYIGEKGKAANGNASNSFLARNGLAYGSWYYFNGSLPGTTGNTNNGSFDTTSSGALSSSKLEDIDTSPSDPTKVILGDQDSGVFTFDLNLVFSGGFNAGASSFTVTKTSAEGGSSNSLDSPDNIDWTAATTLNGINYPEGIIYINEDNGSGEIWQMNPDGSGKIRIGQTNVGAESTGIFDLSGFLDYEPGSILISNNQGSPSSMTLLINPDATLADSCGGPCNTAGSVNISGIAQEGQTLLANISDSNGVSGSVAYTWVHSANGSVGTDMSYIPSAADVGGTVTLNAIYVDDDGYQEDVTSGPSDVIAPAEDTQAPSVPSGLIASNVTTSSAQINWQASSDNVAVAGYLVRRDGGVVGDVSATSLNDVGLMGNSSYSYTVEAYDAAGNFSGQSSALVVVTDNNSPTASFNFNANLLTVDFVDASSDSDGNVVAWDWDFGDGTGSTQQNPTHNYLSVGTYTVTLTVTDDANATGSVSQSITVNDTAPEPIAITGFTPNTVPAANATYSAVISGSGFESGASVSLLNGSGPTPSLSNVVVVDSQTINATLDVKKGGPQGARYWDVIVTNPDGSSAVLDSGLTIVR